METVLSVTGLVMVLFLGHLHIATRHYVALVSTPDQRARDKDRDAAIEIVEAAWADGQIIEADRDKRVEELLRAQTLGEISMLTHDLQAAAPATRRPVPPPPETPAAPMTAPPTPYGAVTRPA